MKKHLLLFALLLLISGAMYGQHSSEPSLNVEPNSLSFSVEGSGPSESQPVTITGSNLTENVNVRVTERTAAFEVSINQNESFVEQLTIDINESGQLDTIVYVRMKAGLTQGNHNGTLTISSGSETEATVSLSGEVTEQPTYNITYSPDSNHTSNGCYISGVVTAQQGDTVTVTVTTAPGYELYTLTYNGTNVPFDNGEYKFSMPASDVTVTATFSQSTYNITYELNGGSVATTNPSTYTIETPTFTLNNPTKTGYNFSGWTGTDLTEPTQTVTITHGSTGDRTYTANWTPISYTITTNVTPQGAGTVTGGGNNFHYEDEATLTATPNQHYTFNQWQDGNTDNPRNITVTGNATYTANFSINQYTITTNVTPEGAGTVTGGGTYNYNAHIVLTATPNPGYSFLRWNDNSEQNPRQITVTGNDTYTATFSQETYLITTNVSPQGAGSVTGGGAFHYGDTPTLTATANSGYDFLSWNDNVTQNPRTITVTGNATYTAHFAQQGVTYYNVTADVTPVGAGNVTGTGSFPAGSTTQLQAIPNTGYHFQRWSDGNTQNPHTITVNNNISLTAHFEQDNYTITTNVTPQGAGTVSGGGNNYHYGQQAQLTATANPGYSFLRWNDNSQQNPRTITVTGNATYTAHFAQEAPVEYTITVQAEPEDGGSVEGEGTYTQGTTATLRAIPNEHYTFEKWQDDNTQNPRQITVTGDATYTAYFTTKIYTINTKVEPLGGGRVEGGGEYHYGEQIELTATAFDGYTFEKWQDGDTLNPRRITVTGDATYTAYFTTNIYTINVMADPEEGGTVDGGGTFHYGDSCTVTATENEHFVFIGWTENDEHVSGEMTYRFQVEGDRNLVAKFASEYDCIIYVDIVPEGAGTVTGAGVYTPGDPCTLKAMAKPGFIFKNWTLGDAVVSEEATYSFTVEETARYTANFDRKAYSITVQAEPEDGGDVSGSGYYYYGTNVTIGAIAKPDYEFSKWLNDENIFVSSEDTITIRVTSDASYTAIFTQNQLFTINAISNPEEGGTAIVINGPTFAYGANCKLMATANSGYVFSNWTLNDDVIVSIEPTYEFSVTEDATFTANFTLIQQSTITVTAAPVEGGTVSGGDSYPVGEQVTVTATPNEHYTFVNWTENGNEVWTNPSYTFTVMRDRDLVAHFKEIPCIEDINEIVAKKHADNTGTYTLVLIYPNPAEAYDYQWLYSTEENGAYLNLDEGTDQYYYKGGALDNGWYKVRLTKKDDTSCKGETNPIMVNNSHRTIHIYPNPARQGNNIVIENSTEGSAQLIVSSIDGRVLHTQTLTDKQTTINLNLALGIYVVRIIDSEGYTSVNKLIIQ